MREWEIEREERERDGDKEELINGCEKSVT